MKLLKSLSALVLVVLFFSCSKDNATEFVINGGDRTINYDEQLSLTTNIADGSIQWSSSDEYVGTVDANGNFSAQNIGETVVTAQSNGRTTSTTIVVEPYITGIVEPSTGYGSNKAAVKAFEKRSLFGESTNMLTYSDGSQYVNQAVYIFQNNVYVSCGLLFKSSPSTLMEDIATFYDERYNYIGTSSNIYVFADRDLKTAVAVTMDNQIGLVGFYQQYTAQTTSSSLREHFPTLKGGSKIPIFEKYAK